VRGWCSPKRVVEMRGFGIGFLVVGLTVGAISARAISDPESRIGWARFTDDPWSQGLFLGLGLVLIGLILLVSRRRMSHRSQSTATRVLVTAAAAVLGFLLMAPVVATGQCADGPGGGTCETVSWSTLTRLTFEGNPHPFFGLVAGSLLAAATWLLTGRLTRTS
jgi:hypothetical protein